MKAPPFAYVRATSLSEALALLSNPDAKAIAGGQSLLATLAFRLSQPDLLVDIAKLTELCGISRNNGRIRIGALTTHTTLSRDANIISDVPLLASAAQLIAHPAIRNRGTIGGSLAYADPAAELPACVVALDADIIIASAKGERRVKAEQFFTSLFSTVLGNGELVAAVEVQARDASDRSAIEEIARRSGDFAMAGAAVRLRMDGDQVRDARIVCFGVGDIPVPAQNAAAALTGCRLDNATIEAAAHALDRDLEPPADQHGSSQTKRHFARVVVARALSRLQERHE